MDRRFFLKLGAVSAAILFVPLGIAAKDKHLHCDRCLTPILRYTGKGRGPKLGDSDYADKFSALGSEEPLGVCAIWPCCPNCGNAALQAISLIW